MGLYAFRRMRERNSKAGVGVAAPAVSAAPAREFVHEFIARVQAEHMADQLACDICGRVCASALGLSAHKRSHK